MGLHGLVAALEILAVLVAPHEAHVWNGLNELFGLGENAGVGEEGPELLGLLEGFVDVESFGDVDAAVVVLLGVVQLAERGVTGASIVPRVGAFLGDFGEGFDDLNFEGGVELVEEDSQGCAHYSTADENDIGFCHRCDSFFHELGVP